MCGGGQWEMKSNDMQEEKRGQISGSEGLVRVFRPLPVGTRFLVCIFIFILFIGFRERVEEREKKREKH